MGFKSRLVIGGLICVLAIVAYNIVFPQGSIRTFNYEGNITLDGVTFSLEAYPIPYPSWYDGNGTVVGYVVLKDYYDPNIIVHLASHRAVIDMKNSCNHEMLHTIMVRNNLSEKNLNDFQHGLMEQMNGWSFKVCDDLEATLNDMLK